DGVTAVKEGDHVVLHWRKGAGIEAEPPRYKWGEIIVGAGPIATFSEYAVISENRMTRISDDYPFDIAALMGCAVTTGLGIINNEAKLKTGESIAVIGCGGVGLNVIQGAVMVSANPIYGVDIYEGKRNMARCFGVTEAFHAVERIPVEVDVVVECTGIPEIIEQALKVTALGGRLILVGQPRHNQNLIIQGIRQHYCGKTILDSQGGLTDPAVDIPRYLELYRRGKLKLDNLITHRYPLTQINTAIEK
ncbi:unnamed protein product, partial [marine sediment metagenome]